jgi:dihydroflavonol-4-reductase
MGRVLLDLYHRRLPALVDGGFDWVDVRDVVAGALAAADRAPTGARYLLSGARRTVGELAAIAKEVTGVRPPLVSAPMWLARVGAPFATAYARVAGKEPLYTKHSLHALRNHQLVSHDKATRELGYTSRPLVETITAAYAWFRAHGALAS